jgi:hypothetical protein
MISKNNWLLSFVFFLIFISEVGAHQPVMDMAPRWEDGYGFQVRYENSGSKELLNGDSKVANSNNDKLSINNIWLEGVYTFDKSIRVTFKLPHITQTRTVNGVKEVNEGVGDLILGVPIKYYKNKGAFTSNLGLTPQIRLPTGSSSGNLPIGDGSTDVGLSVSYSTETPKFYTMFDLFYWLNSEGDRGINGGNELGLDINLGYHPVHNNITNTGVFIMLDVTVRNQESGYSLGGNVNGGSRIYTGPVLVLYRDNVMFRAEYKVPVYEYFKNTGFSRGKEFNAGIGITF